MQFVAGSWAHVPLHKNERFPLLKPPSLDAAVSVGQAVASTHRRACWVGIPQFASEGLQIRRGRESFANIYNLLDSRASTTAME